MKNITVLLTQFHRPLSLAALIDVFDTVNQFYIQKGQTPFFNIKLAGFSENHSLNGLPVALLSSIDKTDLIFIPAFKSGSINEFLKHNYELVPWLQHHFNKGAEIASFCTGTFMLAATGLLNGKNATTHILASHELKQNFPEIFLQRDKVTTDDGGIYTSGGATSSFHLMLYLIEKFCGREIAIQTSKYFSIDMGRNQQSYFDIFNPAKQYDDHIILRAQQQMDLNFKDIQTLDEIIKDLPVSRRNFIRRFKHAIGIPPIQYLQNLRIEAAKEMLERTHDSISDITMKVGYCDVKAFRNLFRRVVGLTPGSYREKFIGKKQVVVN